MKDDIIFFRGSNTKESPYDPWKKMAEAIADYRKNEEAGTIVFTDEPIIITIPLCTSSEKSPRSRKTASSRKNK
jgi:hypothetical protein